MPARKEFFLFPSCGGVAQLVERGSHKPYVVGSTPTAATICSRPELVSPPSPREAKPRFGHHRKERQFSGRMAPLGLGDATGSRSRAASAAFPEHIQHIELAMRPGGLQHHVGHGAYDFFRARASEDALVGHAPQPIADLIVDLPDLG